MAGVTTKFDIGALRTLFANESTSRFIRECAIVHYIISYYITVYGVI